MNQKNYELAMELNQAKEEAESIAEGLPPDGGAGIGGDGQPIICPIIGILVIQINIKQSYQMHFILIVMNLKRHIMMNVHKH